MQLTGSFRLLFDHNPLPMWIYARRDLRILKANQAAMQQYGYSEAEFACLRLLDFQAAGSQEPFETPLKDSPDGLQKLGVVRYTRKNGAPLDVEVIIHDLEYEGEPAQLAVMIDVTSQVRAGSDRDRLAAERDRLLEELQLVMEHMPVGCLINDPDGKITYWNPAAEKIFGFRADEVLGSNTDPLVIPSEEQAQVDRVRQQLAAGAQYVHSVNQNRTRDGRLITCEWENTPLHSDDGQFRGFLAMVRDITEQQRTAQALEHSERRFRTLFEDAPMPIWLGDFSAVKRGVERCKQNGVKDIRRLLAEHPEERIALVSKIRLLEINQAAVEMCHAASKVELLSRAAEVLGEETIDGLIEMLALIADGRPMFDLETAMRTLDGQTLWVIARWQVAPGHEELADQVLVSAVDVSQRRQREADQARSVGRLQLLTQAAVAINGARDLDELLQGVVDWARQITGAALAVASLSEGSGENQRIYALNVAEEVKAVPIVALREQVLTRDFFKTLFAQGKTVHYTAKQLARGRVEYLQDAQTLHDLRLAGYLAVPLIGQAGNPLGILHLGDWKGDPFDTSDEALITQLGLIAATALEKQNLMDQLRQAEGHMRELARQVVNAQETERQLIARELHDETGQNLTALKLSLQMTVDDLAETDAGLRGQLRESIGLAETVMNQTRELARLLRPPRLEAISLRASLEGLCIDFSKRLRIPVTFQGDDLPALDDLMALSIYRFVQEGLTNAARHAQASAVQVSVAQVADGIEAAVEDDGLGFDTAELRGQGGMGLRGMQERIEMLDGRLRILTRRGQGTRLVAHIPWGEQA